MKPRRAAAAKTAASSLFGSGAAQLLGALIWGLMALSLQPTLRLYAVSPCWGLALPAIAAMYLMFTLVSAYQHSRGRGGECKGRVHGETSSREASGHSR